MSAISYRAIWRWHFHAGLFCIPFVVLLAITGSIYLFKPQIDAIADRDVNHLALTGRAATAAAQVDAARAAVPGSHFVAYELPREPDDAVRVHVGAADGVPRIVYLHPETRAVLKIVERDARLPEFVKTLHGELLLGKVGSVLVELAACWAIVMLATGLYLWWPRNASGLAGILWPRLRAGRTTFWRDLHAVTGIWTSAFAIFLLLTALPWTTVWGNGFKQVRAWAEGPAIEQDWTTGPASGPGDGHEGHQGHHDHGMHGAAAPGLAPAYPLDAVVAYARAQHIAPPVLVQPPGPERAWTVRGDSQTRPLRREIALDADTGAVLRDAGFAQRKLIDRVIGVGISAHEGQLFGLANQLLGLATALGLVTICVSALVMWWRRRPAGELGLLAPKVPGYRIERGLAIGILGLAVLLPVFGASLVIVALFDRLLFARAASAA
jgi:uncharacterized iron-regulated membrane protein